MSEWMNEIWTELKIKYKWTLNLKKEKDKYENPVRSPIICLLTIAV